MTDMAAVLNSGDVNLQRAAAEALKPQLYMPYVNHLGPVWDHEDFQEWIDYALEAASRTPRGAEAFATRKIKLPFGQFEFGGTVNIHKTVNSAFLNDQQSITIEGDGLSGSMFIAAITGLTLFSVKNVQINFAGFGMLGHADGTTKGFKLGNESTFEPVFQSAIRDFKMTRMNKGIVCGQLFDSKIENFAMLAFAGADFCGIDILAHATDNSNFVNVDRGHFEEGAAGTFVRSRSSLGSSQVHQNWNFQGCHFETRAYNTKCVDLQGMINACFYDNVMTRNNNDGGVGAGIAYTASAPLITLDSCYGINVHGGSIQHGGAQHADTPKVIKLTGATRRFKVDGTYIASGLDKANPGISDLVDSTGITTGDTAAQAVTFRDVTVNNFGNTPINSAMQVSGKTNGNRQYRLNTELNPSGSDDLIIEYSNDAAGQTWTTLARFNKAGTFDAGEFVFTSQQSIVDDGTATYSMPDPDSKNVNKRGFYWIAENGPNNAWAIVWSTGAALTTIAAGADVVIGNTNPDTDDKLNIYLSGTSIALKNRRGSTRTYGIQAMGFGGKGT